MHFDLDTGLRMQMKDLAKSMRAALPQAIQKGHKKAFRGIVRLSLKVMKVDKKKQIKAERYIRGREQYRRLKIADAVIVSYAKSGRTWLRIMISRLYQQVYDLPENSVIGFDNFHNMDNRVPRLFFTHDNYISDYTGHMKTKLDFYDKKVLLMVRDPRDVAVSSFFHWRFRAKLRFDQLNWKKQVSFYPSDEREFSLFDFLCQDAGALRRVIDFMNDWAKEVAKVRAHEIIRYEDMRAEPVTTLTRVARFLEIPANAAQIKDAVEYASYENMKKKESGQGFRSSGARLSPGDKNNPDSYKVRRAKVGGYRDYFEDAQIKVIDAIVTENLDLAYGYNQSKMADIKSD